MMSVLRICYIAFFAKTFDICLAKTRYLDIDIACARLAQDNLYLFPHDSNSSFYWECLNGKKTLLQCPEGLHFNVIDQSCNNLDSLAQERLISVSKVSTSSSFSLPACSHVPSGTLVLQENIRDPTKYWRCDGKLSVQGSCPKGLIFNQDKQACDFRFNDGNNDDSVSLKNPNKIPQGIKNDPQCSNLSSVSYLPHSFDCTKFVKCANNKSYEMACPEGFQFDKEERKCKDPLQVKCAVDPRCNSTNGYVRFLPHPSDCHKFIECYNGMSHVFECQLNLIFDEKEQKCNFYRPGNCIITEPPWAVPDSVCLDVKPGEIDVKKCICGCNFYWECKGTTQTLKRCPRGLIFSEKKRMCSLSSECSSSTRRPFAWTTPEPQPSEYKHPLCVTTMRGYFAHPNNCSKFMECKNNIAHERDCPDGLLFSERYGKCEHPSRVECRMAKN